jgi:DNA-binding SARP family transcriptional activator
MDRIRALPDVARAVIGGLVPTVLPHPPSLRFYGFGPGQIERDGEAIPVSVWRSALARQLTFYLLVHPYRSREQIIAAFWPDGSPEKAGAIFRWVKHQIRHALERPLVVHEEGLYHIEWDPDCWFDVAAFESLLKGQDGRQVRLERAIALYQGDFLEGCDAEWCEPIRERLRRSCRNALVELGEIHTARGEYDRAFGVLSRALTLDGFYEPASRALMRLYARDGRRHAALRYFERLARNMQLELGTIPEPQTQALYRAIRDGADLDSPDF